jgi:hypothetical protein
MRSWPENIEASCKKLEKSNYGQSKRAGILACRLDGRATTP